MEEHLLQFFGEYRSYAVLISIIINIIIAVLGVVPSFFLTAANIIFFGFWYGTFVSFVGEVLGAAVSFWLYRKGFRQFLKPTIQRYPKVRKLADSTGSEAFYLILMLRVMPLIPSGLVSFAAAVGKVSAVNFIFASSLGKIPALLIEAFSAAKLLTIAWGRSWLLELVLAFGFYWLWKKARKAKSNKKKPV